eukprot:908253_1
MQLILMASRVPFALGMAGAGSFFSATYQYNQTKTSEEYLSRISSDETVPCPNKLTSNDKYKKVSIKGTIDNRNTIIMGPHKHDNEWGSYVYSPLKLESGETVIINQGWIPQNKLKKYYENTIEKTKPQTKHYEGIVSPQEIEPALFFEIDKKINQKMDTVKEDGVISAIWEFNENKNKKKIKTLIQKSKYLVVDLLDDGG